uniref:Uncharacterized protein n=1 Tax=Trichuris muris TaxID=70415 RepID=A0A5S6QAK6_TRIMR
MRETSINLGLLGRPFLSVAQLIDVASVRSTVVSSSYVRNGASALYYCRWCPSIVCAETSHVDSAAGSKLLYVSGCNKSKHVCKFLFIKSSAGLNPVDEDGVTCCDNKNLAICKDQSPFVILFSDSFVACTILSACPFEEGWYGAVVT